MRKTFIFLSVICFTSLAKAQEMKFPLIKEFGRVADFEKAIKPQEGAKILIDLTTSETTESGMNKGWEKVARLINLYAISGISTEDLKIAVIVHGGATKSILSNEAYKSKYKINNPDLPLIKAVQNVGVEVSVCSQAIAHRGFTAEGVDSTVSLALSAITVLVNYQNEGYAVIYF